MTATSTRALVIRDTEGEYYVIPLSAIERGRVAEEDKAALESALADETSGYTFTFGTPFGVADVRVMDLHMPIPKPDPSVVDPTQQFAPFPRPQPRPH